MEFPDISVKCNVGTKERMARSALGVAAGVAAWRLRNKTARVALGGIGLFGLATAATTYCPLNQLLGVDHCQAGSKSLTHALRRL